MCRGHHIGDVSEGDRKDDRASRRALFQLFLHERSDPEPFYTKLAHRDVSSFRFDLRSKLVLDLACGQGFYAAALTERGAVVVPTDLDEQEIARHTDRLPRALVSNAVSLPFASGTFDGVFCSNLLEHTPNPKQVVDEIERVLRPRGWAYVSWTNWYSPWGGHAITPFHYLGPHLGLTAYRALLGEPKGKNLPYERLWPTYIGRTIRDIQERPRLRLLDVFPRYYPSQRWIVRVPGLRELATWNCVLLLERC
jgi:SAM-dependent methyltransferase